MQSNLFVNINLKVEDWRGRFWILIFKSYFEENVKGIVSVN